MSCSNQVFAVSQIQFEPDLPDQTFNFQSLFVSFISRISLLIKLSKKLISKKIMRLKRKI